VITPIPFNAYSSWLEVAESAQGELVIFSPFFDEMVLHLFDKCPLEALFKRISEEPTQIFERKGSDLIYEL